MGAIGEGEECMFCGEQMTYKGNYKNKENDYSVLFKCKKGHEHTLNFVTEKELKELEGN